MFRLTVQGPGYAKATAGLPFLPSAVLELFGERLRVRWRRWFAAETIDADRAALTGVRLSCRVVEVSGQYSRRHQEVYEVRATFTGKDLPAELLMGKSNREATARRAAEAFARAFAVNFFDAVGDAVEERAPAELDRTFGAATSAPEGAPPAGLQLRHGPAGQELVTVGLLGGGAGSGSRRTLALAVGGLLCTTMAAVWFTHGLEPGIARRAIAATVFSDLILALVLLWVLRCETRVSVHGGLLHVVRGCMGLPLQHARLPVSTVERLRLQTHVGSAHPLQYGIAVVTDQRTLILGRGLGAPALQWLLQWLAHALATARAQPGS
jgi:hypothetical protein